MKRIYRAPHNPTAPWLPHEYLLESDAEAAQLPTEGVPAGSLAHTVSNSTRKMMGADGQWENAPIPTPVGGISVADDGTGLIISTSE